MPRSLWVETDGQMKYVSLIGVEADDEGEAADAAPANTDRSSDAAARELMTRFNVNLRLRACWIVGRGASSIREPRYRARCEGLA